MSTERLIFEGRDGAGHAVSAFIDVQVAPSTGVLQDPVIGVDWNSDTAATFPVYFTDWDASRVYRINQVIPAFNAWTPRVIAVTDDPNVSRSSGAAGAKLVRDMLISFYEGTGSAARRNCEIHWANGNEVDREYKTVGQALPQNVVDTWRLMYEAIHELLPSGARRFPKASMWVDITEWGLANYGAAVKFKAIAPYLDGCAYSLYPPGRQADPVVWTAYSQYIDEAIRTTRDWMDDFPNITMIACWEVGSPIDHAQDATGGPNYLGTTNWTIRPRYFCGGRASNGTNYEGFLNYLYRKCVENRMTLREIIYWNRMDNEDIPNAWKHDRNLVSPAPDTVTAWHTWTPGSRLADL